MNDRELMQQALEALDHFDDVDKTTAAITALRERLAQPEQTVSIGEYKQLQKLVISQGIRLMEYESEQPVQEPVAHSIVAGALFDFMGWLTSRKERIVLSSADNASPAVEAITEFAKMRGLSLADARVNDWQDMTRGNDAA